MPDNFQSWPANWPWYKQACYGSWNDRCDMLVGPCRCGAWHDPGEFDLQDGMIYRYGEPATPVTQFPPEKNPMAEIRLTDPFSLLGQVEQFADAIQRNEKMPITVRTASLDLSIAALRTKIALLLNMSCLSSSTSNPTPPLPTTGTNSSTATATS